VFVFRSMFLISGRVSVENWENSMHIFFMIMSFWVKVPVLSVKRTSTQPSSSGIEEFRVIVSAISLSLSIEYEYQIFAKSKLTLSEIGMIEHKRSTNLKNMSPQFP